MINVAAGVKVSEDLNRLVPAVLASQPARGAGEKEQPAEEDNAGDHLEAPGDAEGSGGLLWVFGAAANVRRAVLDEVLDQDAPSNGPLLQRDNAATDLLRRDLGLVDRDNSGGDADADAGDRAADDKHGNAVAGALDSGAVLENDGRTGSVGGLHGPDHPEDAGALDGGAAGIAVGDEGGKEGAEKGSKGHGGSDGALGGGNAV